MEDRHLITVDELRAAGALDVPPAWRKSLGVERDLFTDLFKDDDAGSEDQPEGVDGKSKRTEAPDS
ncbi:MAG TPA: hypothetical protein VEI07_16285 [Planctomycetaceae bacterium]|nr:hypothetical protein [Planctomycetaceae bacterium]